MYVSRNANKAYYDGWLSKGDIDAWLRGGKMRYSLNVDVTSYKDGVRRTHNVNDDGSAPPTRTVIRASPTLTLSGAASTTRMLSPRPPPSALARPLWKISARSSASGNAAPAATASTPPTPRFSLTSTTSTLSCPARGQETMSSSTPKRGRDAPRFPPGTANPRSSPSSRWCSSPETCSTCPEARAPGELRARRAQPPRHRQHQPVQHVGGRARARHPRGHRRPCMVRALRRCPRRISSVSGGARGGRGRGGRGRRRGRRRGRGGGERDAARSLVCSTSSRRR